MKFLPGKRAVLVLLAVVALAFWVAGQAAASITPLSFFDITNNGNADLSGQLTVNVYLGQAAPNPAGGTVAIGVNQVGFYFVNAGPIASSVKDIYFDDGSLGTGPTIYDNPLSGNTGVDFVLGADPADLPGGNNILPHFVATIAFNSEADNPSGLDKKGIDVGESLLLVFSTTSDVMAALNLGDLRIGLHVGSIGTTEGSDSYVNSPPGGDIQVPIPPSVLLMGSGLLGLGLVGWRRRQKKA